MSQALATSDRRGRLLFLVAAMMVVAIAGVSGVRSMASAQGGPNAICQAMGFDYGFKVGEDPTGTHTVTYEDAEGETQTAGSLTVTENEDETGIDWSSTFAVYAVLVKGGPGHNTYDYAAGSMGDTGLLTNVNPNNPNGENYELSNAVFCYDGLENGSEDPQVLQHTVSIAKWVEGAVPTSGSFDFTATWTADNLNGGVETSGNFTLNGANAYMATTSAMDAGASYSVVENGIDMVCDEGDAYRLIGYSVGSSWEEAQAATPGPSASITDLQSNQYVVVHNAGCGDVLPTGNGSITIVKQGLTEGVDATFTHNVPGDSDTFTLDWENNSITFDELPAGDYQFTELPIEGWTLLGAGCSLANARGIQAEDAAAGNTVVAVLGEDMDLVCTFVNGLAQELQHTVTIHKYVDGALATEGSFDFTATWTAANLNGGLEDTGNFTLSDANVYTATTAEMDAGASYSVVENGIDATCEPGDVYRLLGYGIGETLEAAAAAEPVETAAFIDLQADQYVVVQNEPCPVGTSSITIVKEGLTDGVEAVFVHDIPGDSDTFTLTAEDNSFTVENLEAGTYSFTELPIEGWRLVSAGCGFSSLSPDTVGDTLNVVVGDDEDIVCTFVNEMEPNSVTIEKFVDGQTALEGSFEFTQTTPAAETVVTLDSSNAFVQSTDDIPGGTSYSLSENGIDAICEGDDEYRLAGYTMGATREEALAADLATEVNIEALMNDLYVIVWNQDCDNLGSITIVKDFNPDANAQASFTAEGIGVEDFTIAEGDANGMTFESLGIGDYTFTEDFLAGWRVQSIFCAGQQSPSAILIDLGAGAVTVSLTAGDDITCTFTNMEDATTVPGSITIVKDWGEDAGVDTTFTVSENLGVDGNSITLADSEGADSMAFADIAPDTYTFAEDPLEGWTLTGINCEGQDSPDSIVVDLVAGSLTVNLSPGEVVVCTFMNAMDDFTPVETGSITITKVANPDIAATFSFTATGEGLSAFNLVTGDVANPATTTFAGLAIGSYSVTELDLEGWTLTDITCTGAGEGSATGDVATGTTTIELVAGAAVECTYTNTQDELAALLDFVPFINNPGTSPVTNETPNVSVPSNTGTELPSSIVGSEQPAFDTTGNVPSANQPNPAVGGSQEGTESSVLGARSAQTPQAPSTGTGLAAGGSTAASPLGIGIIIATLLGGTAAMAIAASRR